MRIGHYQQRVLLGLLVLAAMLLYSLGILHSRFIENLEAFAYDVRLRLAAPGPAKNSDVVIISIGQKSLAAEGRWPWPRYKLAKLIHELNSHYHVAVIGLDMAFPDPERDSGLAVLKSLSSGPLHNSKVFQEQMGAWKSKLDYDGQLAQQLRLSPSVLGYYFTTVEGESKPANTGVLPPPTFPPGAFRGRHLSFVTGNAYGGNLPLFEKSAKAAGCFTVIPDFDGVLRRAPMLLEYHGAYYDSLPLAVADLYLGSPPIKPGFPKDAPPNYQVMEWLQMGSKRIPVGPHGSALIPYRGTGRTFPFVSATDVMNKKAPMGALFGKIALVGMTAPGLLDLHATPVGTEYPGIEAQASLVYGILHGTIKERPGYVTAIAASMIVLLGLILLFLLPLLSPLRSLLAAVLALAITVAVNLLAWTYGNLVVPIAPAILLIAGLFVVNTFYGYFFETRKRKYILSRFGQYVPPSLVREMAKFPETLSMQGQSRDMTVLFADVCNFTRISEGLSPTELSAMINMYLTAMTEVIQKYKGTVDKYIGDAIMAFWNAPLPDNRHGRNAIMAALEMQAKLAELESEFKAKGWPALRAGIGINSGVMNVGNMGSQFRMAYTVMGDAVNTASRLEGLTRKYGVDIIVGADTRRLVPEVIFREIDVVRVKGREKAVSIYEPISLRSKMDADQFNELNQFEQMRAYYRKQRWTEAMGQLAVLLEKNPSSKLYALYRERIEQFMASPPGDEWDGVFNFQTK
ncbi:CHASE2 domain-containing protein [Acidithiobacillus sulfuriphilus]|uniref:CHASE2 domain-containing protein n=1 Tax=Acidithiobacillus sulfuriphilus TaxID=1867749 RepID=UPI003F5F8DAE